MDSAFGFTTYNGQNVLGATPQEMANLQSSADQYNAATGQTLTPQQYDQMINPSTYGARWGEGASSAPMTDANQFLGITPYGQTPATPQTPASQDASFGFGSNPYLGQQSDAIRAEQAQLFGDLNNQIRSNSVATGGLGGTREGVAQGVAMGRAATGLDSALAGLYGNAYNADQNRALSQYQGDQSFYTSQRGQDLQQAGVGASLYNMGVQGQWSPYQNYSGTLSPYTGFGQTTGTTQSGGGVQPALGGALGTYQLGHAAGWW